VRNRKKLARLQAIVKYQNLIRGRRGMAAPTGNGPVIPILGFLTCVAFIYLSFGDLWFGLKTEGELAFVKRNGTQFVVDGKALYVNGWNSYWFMDHAVNDHSRHRVSAMLEAGAKMGLTVCRTWAFNDGGYNALQISPGRFDERVFKVSFCRHI